ncbi:MAG: M14 metallopeptidase family protein, partial [Bacteroidota bacterium]
MKKTIVLLLLCSISSSLLAQLKAPDQFLGYTLGTYFSRHHQVTDYFRHLEANGSGMIKLQTYGKTNENRELIVAFISSQENISRLDLIRNNHENGREESVAIVWLSYNVHGNESAGTEAAMMTAHELITTRKDWLKNTVVIIDPCINPDGRDRYVNWYNQQMNTPYNAHVETAEHDEPWPSGRPNHYLFDLNRDWAWLTQVESQQRIALYNRWLPHVHVDFHEQGMNEPYYFAPAAEPYHEVITKWQREFQNGVGRNNAKYFDQNGWFYFTREIFDLLYPSYGDTYPTYNGAIGMTYEQGGSGRGGLGVITAEGDTLTLRDRIQHHHISGISTVEFSVEQKDKLIREFNIFNSNKSYKYKTYAVSGNEEKLSVLMDLLDRHEILYSFGDGNTLKGYDYASGKQSSVKLSENHLLIQTDQKKGTLVNVLFEPKTYLSDSLTYDITAWSLPYAYGLDCIASENKITGKAAKAAVDPAFPESEVYAYLLRWDSMEDAKALSELIQNGIKVRYSESAFSFGDKKYAPGTLIIVCGENETKSLESLLNELVRKYRISIETTKTGMVDTGKDFGSSAVKLIKNKRIALLTGDQTSSLNVGEIWHFMEKELKYPISMLHANSVTTESLQSYDVLIVPEGWYRDLSGTIGSWASSGGTVIAIGDALSMFNEQNGFSLSPKSDNKEEEKEEDRHEHAHVPYDKLERESVKEIITGAIFKCKVENTNPLAFGYGENYFTLKLSGNGYSWMKNGGNVVYLEKDATPIAGFAGSKAIPRQSESLIIGHEHKGSGTLIYLVDN